MEVANETGLTPRPLLVSSPSVSVQHSEGIFGWHATRSSTRAKEEVAPPQEVPLSNFSSSIVMPPRTRALRLPCSSSPTARRGPPIVELRWEEDVDQPPLGTIPDVMNGA
jgi:hypothetical protein